MKAMLGFCALPNDSVDVVNPHIDNLSALLCAILLTRIIKLSVEDGRSRAEQLLHMLRQIDQYVSSQVEYQRRRGCWAVYEMLLCLLKFRTVCISGYCAPGCRQASWPYCAWEFFQLTMQNCLLRQLPNHLFL